MLWMFEPNDISISEPFLLCLEDTLIIVQVQLIVPLLMLHWIVLITIQTANSPGIELYPVLPGIEIFSYTWAD